MTQQYQIYIRNNKKYGKILRLQKNTTYQQIYSLAAATQSLNSNDILLIAGGQIIQTSAEQAHFNEKSILHLINLNEVRRDEIEISIRSLGSNIETLKFLTKSDTTIQQFINTNLLNPYGQNSNSLALVHIGRQLPSNSTFRQCFVENQAEVFCVNLEQIKKKQTNKAGLQQAIPIRQLQVAEEPNNIYPDSNFIISDHHKEINANNNIDLIFDSKIKHSSSLPKEGFHLEPNQIIDEGQQFKQINNENNQAYKNINEGLQNQNIPNINQENIQKSDQNPANDLIQIQDPDNAQIIAKETSEQPIIRQAEEVLVDNQQTILQITHPQEQQHKQGLIIEQNLAVEVDRAQQINVQFIPSQLQESIQQQITSCVDQKQSKTEVQQIENITEQPLAQPNNQYQQPSTL